MSISSIKSKEDEIDSVWWMLMNFQKDIRTTSCVIKTNWNRLVKYDIYTIYPFSKADTKN